MECNHNELSAKIARQTFAVACVESAERSALCCSHQGHLYDVIATFSAVIQRRIDIGKRFRDNKLPRWPYTLDVNESHVLASLGFDIASANMTLDDPVIEGSGSFYPFSKGQLPPEPPLGNMEYKLKLIPVNETRRQHLSTQLKWRLKEGFGEAIYEIGVRDDGKVVGISEEDMRISLTTIDNMAKSIGAEILLTREFLHNGKHVAEVVLRRLPDNTDEFVDFRIALLGNVDSGKSTILGVLSSGELDNGRGKARLNLFRHPHEIQTGRTSSVSREILGFSIDGQVVNYRVSDTSEEILQQSFKLITFTDLAGHHKYIRTTISGLMASKPDFVMLVVSALVGCNQSTVEHLSLAAALRLPVFAVITKTDCCDLARISKVIGDLTALTQSTDLPSDLAAVVQTEDECLSAAYHMACGAMMPIFTVSNVTGQNLNLLTRFLSMLPCTVATKARELSLREPAEFQIDKCYRLDGVGKVVSGILTSGTISPGTTLALGPSFSGGYTKVLVKSIQRSHTPCQLVRTGQSVAVCIVLDDEGFRIRRGMVLTDIASPLNSCLVFEAVLRILCDVKVITKGLQGTVHCGYICQTAVVTDVDSQEALSNPLERFVKLKFIKQPECIRTGDRFVFRHGRIKAIGTVGLVMGLDGPVF
ncbi:GTP-binding protein 2 [Hypsibius exemplaris]|uniref:GTP-binding protein 2 n=1 Tax=Hypsibius exemplaris TaxID=2072580 RepID=A0A1W0WCS7_HYPEX|nr:GTP-binding protein 2 [Hypsibius exemplaris]